MRGVIYNGEDTLAEVCCFILSFFLTNHNFTYFAPFTIGTVRKPFGATKK